MNKLRKKVFWTIFGILAAALLVAVVVYNVSGYINTQNMLKQAFNVRQNPFINPIVSQGEYANYVIQSYFANLRNSIIIFFVFNIVFGVISWFITSWIVKPAEESFDKQKEFIADASHELKTPLSVIMASSDALSENPKEIKWIKNINEESHRMNNLITNLLDMSASEVYDKQNFKKDNLSKTVELAALTFEGKALEKNLKLDIDIQQDIVWTFDSDKIKQLVEILLDNAVEHSNPNTLISLLLHKKNKNVILCVKNIGEPISQEEKTKVFDRFYRVDKSRNSKENRYGLGLSIAKNIALLHNASIKCVPQENSNSFLVEF